MENAYSPIVIYPKFDSYKKLVGVDYGQLVNLRSLGLIELDMGVFSTGYEHQIVNPPIKSTYFEKQCEIIDACTIKLGNVLYTYKVGECIMLRSISIS